MRERPTAQIALWAVLAMGPGSVLGDQDDNRKATVIAGVSSPTITARILSTRPAVRPGAVPKPVPAITGASSAVRVGRWLFVAQDDSNLLAALGDDGSIDAIRLFPSVGGADRFVASLNNKMLKPDLEAMVVLSVPAAVAERLGVADDRPTKAADFVAVLVLGSGSTDEYRDRVALIFPSEPLAKSRVVALRATGLYARLRGESLLAGKDHQLNIEGAALVADGGAVRLYNRGNGSGTSITASVDISTRDLLDYLVRANQNPSAPFNAVLTNARRYDLGSTPSGAPVSITDAAVVPPGAGDAGAGMIVLSAVAEETTNMVDDGPTSATTIGLEIADGTLLLAPLRDERGNSGLKVEGIAVTSVSAVPGQGLRILLQGVVDPDATDPSVPSLLAEIELIYKRG
jgi:hypothetical protein